LLVLVPVAPETFGFAVHAHFLAFIHLTASGMAGKCSDYSHFRLAFAPEDFTENFDLDLALHYFDQQLEVTQTAWQPTPLESCPDTSSCLKTFHSSLLHPYPVNYRHHSFSTSFSFDFVGHSYSKSKSEKSLHLQISPILNLSHFNFVDRFSILNCS
jgi:hypothetical protein